MTTDADGVAAEDKFWRSPEGDEEWARLLDAHIERVRAETREVAVHKRISFDVLELAESEGDLRLMLTKGLSHFILGHCIHGARHELSWVIAPGQDGDRAAEALYQIGDYLLDRRLILENGDILDDFDMRPYLPKGATVNHPLVKFELWFSAEDAYIESRYPLSIAEVVPLTSGEIELLRNSEDTFYQRCNSGEIDTLDYFR